MKNVESRNGRFEDIQDNSAESSIVSTQSKFFYPDYDEEVVIYDYEGKKYSYNYNHFVKVTSTDRAEVYDVKTDKLVKLHNGRSWDIIDLVSLDEEEVYTPYDETDFNTDLELEPTTGEYDNIYDEEEIIYVRKDS